MEDLCIILTGRTGETNLSPYTGQTGCLTFVFTARTGGLVYFRGRTLVIESTDVKTVGSRVSFLPLYVSGVDWGLPVHCTRPRFGYNRTGWLETPNNVVVLDRIGLTISDRGPVGTRSWAGRLRS